MKRDKYEENFEAIKRQKAKGWSNGKKKKKQKRVKPEWKR